RNLSCTRVGSQSTENIRAAKLGQQHVQQDEVVRSLTGHAQALFPVAGYDDGVACSRQSALVCMTEKLAVFYKQNGLHIVLLGLHPAFQSPKVLGHPAIVPNRVWLVGPHLQVKPGSLVTSTTLTHLPR